MGKRCQVCDGPIVDGRCKYCGMPYRCDAELYHLNEDRSEHYRHASAKVRKAMRESEIPLPDRSRTVSGTTKTQNVNARKTKNQTVKAQNIKIQDVRKQTAKKQTAAAQTARQQTMGRQTTWTQAQTARTYAGKSPAPAKKKKRKSKKAVIFWVILAGVVALIEYAPEYAERIGYELENFVSAELGIDITGIFSEKKEDYGLPLSQEELAEYESFYIDTDAGTCVAGENEIIPGEYIIESGWEAVALEITEPSGKTETVEFDKAKQQERVELHTGYELTAVSLDEQYNYVALYQIQQYDE